MRPKLPQITEAQFLHQVLTMARLYGWRTLHIRPAIRRSGVWLTPVAGDGKGFPDLLMVRNGSMICAELKVGRNQMTDEQQLWLNALSAVRGDVRVFCWRPSDWDTIEDILSMENK